MVTHKSSVFSKFYPILTLILSFSLLVCSSSSLQAQNVHKSGGLAARERICISANWKFFKYESLDKADKLIYDVRPNVNEDLDNRPADAKPTEAVKVEATIPILKSFILPTTNAFIKDANKKYVRPQGDPGNDFPFVQNTFNDDIIIQQL